MAWKPWPCRTVSVLFLCLISPPPRERKHIIDLLWEIFDYKFDFSICYRTTNIKIEREMIERKKEIEWEKKGGGERERGREKRKEMGREWVEIWLVKESETEREIDGVKWTKMITILKSKNVKQWQNLLWILSPTSNSNTNLEIISRYIFSRYM